MTYIYMYRKQYVFRWFRMVIADNHSREGETDRKKKCDKRCKLIFQTNLTHTHVTHVYMKVTWVYVHMYDSTCSCNCTTNIRNFVILYHRLHAR